MKVGDLIKYTGSPVESAEVNHMGIVTKLEFGGRKVWYCQLPSGKLSWSSYVNLEIVSESR